MKKIVDYSNLDTQTIKHLLKNLPECDFKESLKKLLNKQCSTIILEIDNEEFDYEIINEKTIKSGDIIINEKKRKVERKGEEIFLTPKEFDILFFLAKNKGEVFTKEQIYQAVWTGEYIMDDSNIMAFIRKIRKKIEPYPDKPKYIITIWGIGYKFTDI